MYLDLYNILSNALYGATVLTGWQEMFVTVIASTCLLFVFLYSFYCCLESNMFNCWEVTYEFKKT